MLEICYLVCPQKEKAPDWRRGALFYHNKSTKRVTTLSRGNCVTCNFLNRRTLARLRQAGLALKKRGAVVDKRNEQQL